VERPRPSVQEQKRGVFSASLKFDPCKALRHGKSIAIMRIAIHATGMTRKNTGVGQYIAHLLTELVPLLVRDGCKVLLLVSPDADVSAFDGVARLVPLPIARTKRLERVFLEHLYVPAVSWSAEVYLSLMSVFPFTPVRSRRKLVVIQDILHVMSQIEPDLYPWRCSAARLRYINFSMGRTLRAASSIITLSEFVAEGLKQHLQVEKERISVIPCGVDLQRFHPQPAPGQLADVRRRYGLPERYHLFVGNLAEHKNLRLIVDAYASSGNKDLCIPVAITLPPPQPGNTYSVAQHLEQKGLRDSFRFLGFIPDNDLPLLYGAAQALLYPSLHEGFGIPPLEAMACGIPVVTSNCSALPEVVGDAALTIDPRRPEALIEALHKVNNEAIRRRLIEKGLQRVQGFTWKRVAQQMREVILS